MDRVGRVISHKPSVSSFSIWSFRHISNAFLKAYKMNKMILHAEEMNLASDYDVSDVFWEGNSHR